MSSTSGKRLYLFTYVCEPFSILLGLFCYLLGLSTIASSFTFAMIVFTIPKTTSIRSIIRRQYKSYLLWQVKELFSVVFQRFLHTLFPVGYCSYNGNATTVAIRIMFLFLASVHFIHIFFFLQKK